MTEGCPPASRKTLYLGGVKELGRKIVRLPFSTKCKGPERYPQVRTYVKEYDNGKGPYEKEEVNRKQTKFFNRVRTLGS